MSNWANRITLMLVVAISLGFTTTSGSAAPFSDFLSIALPGGATCNFSGSDATGSPVPVSESGVCGSPVGEADGSARADPGSAGVVAHANYGAGDNLLTEVRSNAESNFGIEFTSTDPNVTSVTTSLNLYLNGRVNSSGGGSANLSVDVEIFAGRILVATANFASNRGVSSCRSSSTIADVCNGVVLPQSGLEEISGIFATGPFEVPLNQNLPFDVRLGSSALASVVGSASVEWGDTAGFPTSGPVFNLPDGFTVNNPGGIGLIDNHYTDPTAISAPEPATLSIFGFGLAGLGFIRRRRAATNVLEGD